MRMHKSGVLQDRHRSEADAEAVDATSEALRAVAERMDEIRDQAGSARKRRRKGLGRRPLLDGLTVPETVEVDFAVAGGAEQGSLQRLRSDEDADLHVLATADEMTLVLPSSTVTAVNAVNAPGNSATTAEPNEGEMQQLLLDLRREKLELKKRKLELLERQHAERMALLQRRLELEEQRAQQEAAARRADWAALLAVLRAPQPQPEPAASSAMDVATPSLSDF